MDAYELTLPWPPSNNHYKGFVSKPRISKRTGKPLKCFFILDNIPKVVLDALQKAGAYFDDSQIDYLLIERKEKYPMGMLNLMIMEIA
jgi:hypothetical protein